MTAPKLKTLTAALSITLLTAACGTDPDRSPETQAVADVINHVFYHAKWQQIPASPENQAEAIVFQQGVFFSDGSGVLDQEGRQAIRELLEEANPDPGTVVSLTAGTGNNTRYDQVSLQRLEAVRIALADQGYEAVLGRAPSVPAPGLEANEVRLSLTKFMPILPDCSQPQPLQPDVPDFSGAFGCSNANNLGVMVANPRDLVEGRTLEPADGEANARSVQRYRLGEITPLAEEETSSQ